MISCILFLGFDTSVAGELGVQARVRVPTGAEKWQAPAEAKASEIIGSLFSNAISFEGDKSHFPEDSYTLSEGKPLLGQVISVDGKQLQQLQQLEGYPKRNIPCAIIWEPGDAEKDPDTFGDRFSIVTETIVSPAQFDYKKPPKSFSTRFAFHAHSMALTPVLRGPLFANYTRENADEAISFLLKHGLVRTDKPIPGTGVLYDYYGLESIPVRDVETFGDDEWTEMTQFFHTPADKTNPHALPVAEAKLIVEFKELLRGEVNYLNRTETTFRYNENTRELVEFEHHSYEKLDEPRSIVCRMPVLIM